MSMRHNIENIVTDIKKVLNEEKTGMYVEVYRENPRLKIQGLLKNKSYDINLYFNEDGLNIPISELPKIPRGIASFKRYYVQEILSVVLKYNNPYVGKEKYFYVGEGDMELEGDYKKAFNLLYKTVVLSKMDFAIFFRPSIEQIRFNYARGWRINIMFDDKVSDNLYNDILKNVIALTEQKNYLFELVDVGTIRVVRYGQEEYIK